jgi:hypothetical protein
MVSKDGATGGGSSVCPGGRGGAEAGVAAAATGGDSINGNPGITVATPASGSAPERLSRGADALSGLENRTPSRTLAMIGRPSAQSGTISISR